MKSNSAFQDVALATAKYNFIRFGPVFRMILFRQLGVKNKKKKKGLGLRCKQRIG